MSRFDFACETYGPKVINSLVLERDLGDVFADKLLEEGLSQEQKDIFTKAAEAYGDAFDNENFLSRLKSGRPTQQDMGKYIRPVFVGFAYIADPTAVRKAGPWKYLNWICRSYCKAAENYRRILAEDLYKIRNDLVDFESFKNALEPEERSIDFYESYKSLVATLIPYQQKRDERRAKKHGRKVDEQEFKKIMLETTVIYDGPEGKIVVPHSERASIYWGQQTRWCTAAEKGGNQFIRYNANEPLWLYMPKPTSVERRAFSDLTSFKYTGTQGCLYNEHDSNPRYLPPFLERLIDAALKDVGSQRRRYLKKYGSFKKYKPIVPSDPKLWGDKKLMLAAVKKHKKDAMDFVPTDLRADAEFMLEAVESDIYLAKYAAAELMADKDFVLKLVSISPEALQYASDELKADRDIVLKAIGKSGGVLEYVSNELKADREIVEIAVNQSGRALEHADDALKGDKEVFLMALNNGYSCYRLPEELQYDKDATLAWVSKDGSRFEYVTDAFRHDEDVIKAAFQKEGYSNVISHVPVEKLEKKKIALIAVQASGENIKHLPSCTRDDRDVIIAAVKQSGDAIGLLSGTLRADKEVVIAAINQDPDSLRFADEELRSDKEIVLAAVRKDGEALQYAAATLRGDREIVMAAITNTHKALAFTSLEYRFNHAVKLQGALLRAWDRAVIRPVTCMADKVKAIIMYSAPDSGNTPGLDM